VWIHSTIYRKRVNQSFSLYLIVVSLTVFEDRLLIGLSYHQKNGDNLGAECISFFPFNCLDIVCPNPLNFQPKVMVGGGK